MYEAAGDVSLSSEGEGRISIFQDLLIDSERKLTTGLELTTP
jgi:hypothetical protein